MNPEIWGKHMWVSIHMTALGCPDNPNKEQKNNYIKFFNSLSSVLPCKSCADHFKYLLKTYPLKDSDLSNNMKLFEWTVFLHNKVNEKLKKEKISFEVAKNIFLDKDSFDRMINNCNNVQDQTKSSQTSTPIYLCFCIILISILIASLIYFIFRKKQLTFM